MTLTRLPTIICMKKGVAEKRLRPKLRFYFSNRNRHLAEWRVLLYTVTVIVYPKIWKVNVIGIAAPPFRECDGTAFLRLATPYPCGRVYSTKTDDICQSKEKGQEGRPLDVPCEKPNRFNGFWRIQAGRRGRQPLHRIKSPLRKRLPGRIVCDLPA